ncbi:hypothetical protein SAMN04488125_1593 [Methylorubrum salsuginis]|uniref:Uncharacterized protein n=1 Tax=Methylorubrum salsuginis TaxID=414703 RepID=A0A1I4N6W8_9HYPH|nr:hypothetical protein SAMN04488125_1593 [Methylorubrum salsuginis]
MTDEMMALRGLMEKGADTDLLGEMIGFAADRPMEMEVGGLTGAADGEKSAEGIGPKGAERLSEKSRCSTITESVWFSAMATVVRLRLHGGTAATTRSR